MDDTLTLRSPGTAARTGSSAAPRYPCAGCRTAPREPRRGNAATPSPTYSGMHIPTDTATPPALLPHRIPHPIPPRNRGGTQPRSALTDTASPHSRTPPREHLTIPPRASSEGQWPRNRRRTVPFSWNRGRHQKKESPRSRRELPDGHGSARGSCTCPRSARGAPAPSCAPSCASPPSAPAMAPSSAAWWWVSSRAPPAVLLSRRPPPRPRGGRRGALEAPRPRQSVHPRSSRGAEGGH